jgi:hypothetical protein
VIAPAGDVGADDEFDSVAAWVFETDEFPDVACLAFLSGAIVHVVSKLLKRGASGLEVVVAEELESGRLILRIAFK